MAFYNNQPLIEKKISFKIPQQFPAHFRENGPELVQLVKDYYEFLETQPDMSVYNNRRLFEYRDISQTLDSMLDFFRKKFMADLPVLSDEKTKFVIKNILDLYRRKGTESGIRLFFRMFYEEDIDVIYPSKYMLKPSDSKWQTGTYLQMMQNNNEFPNRAGTIIYTYLDLISRDIVGSISKARAVVDKINFVFLNKTLTPIIYISNPKGKFIKFDDIVSRIDGEDISFGKLNGSADELEINLAYGGTTGNKVGDIFNLESEYGKGGTCIVTDLEDEFTGTIDYTLLDGGFGYTIENTKILVSNQVLVIPNEPRRFTVLERLKDSANNVGTVIGQNGIAVGLKMEGGQEFAWGRTIETMDRSPNIVIPFYNANSAPDGILTVGGKNDSSPGPLYANTGDPTHAKVETLSNIETVSLITDKLAGFLNVPLNSSNFNTVPPATQPMSGNTDPVTLATALEDAFDLTPFNIGTIETFENIDPGENYVNDVWTLVKDEVMIGFDRKNQILTFDDFNASFSEGDVISQNQGGGVIVSGVILGVNSNSKYINVRPYSYYGFKKGFNVNHFGNYFEVISVEVDYSSEQFGDNADLLSKTLFSQGRIAAAKILNSGFGYIDKETVYLTDDEGTRHAEAELRANSQGITAGFWGSTTSHINGYTKTLAEDGEDFYYDSQMKIQDSDYYQEFSYEIKSTIDPKRYETVLKESMHLAGTKLYGDFIYKNKASVGLGAKMFVQTKDDYIKGGNPIVGPGQSIGSQVVTADNYVYTVDTTSFAADLAR